MAISKIDPWRKTSRSGASNGHCVEVAPVTAPAGADWRKPSQSAQTGGNCVEVAAGETVAAVRDSKNPTSPALVFAPAAFTAFVSAVKEGRLDLS
ncbi:DUF397 domain-containing protein [Streptoalloteichus hindustanus]|uniref:DUF397 domain-containing protein n=1 Tax=Streptoalloteichus hindustanus TaxID=2017 RepID=A0A1M5P8E9_STRHI|nr:protein of unknown function [Streptoalloteichus hindustanus]